MDSPLQLFHYSDFDIDLQPIGDGADIGVDEVTDIPHFLLLILR